ncbi:N-acetylglucosamine-6-phosphate deacetylase [Spirulina subsalsa FACHB-351]|uniref:N-acetylglucosamine-6-phosphate deacetylase n=1 Tax=Spirulina subsalsa FACHB-351 TaxID=234711 RepID=A0ABT3L1V4_9CYAN|nr:N-acetylglucosamine-6-phosphate deacetylase [Spirulina subsalsa FACHB-351]
MVYALTHCTIYTGFEELHHSAVLIEGDRILDVIPQADIPPTCPQIDLQGNLLTAGFIDLQLNGCGGVMFNDDISLQTVETMHHTNLRSGTTSFLPTLITASDQDMLEAIAVGQDGRRHYPYNVLGLHLEGPYLNPKRKGIHNGAYIRPPDAQIVRKIAQGGGDTVRILTLAPECVDPSIIAQLADGGVIVSAGHSEASYEQAKAGFAAGVAMVTHLFNAMTPWLGRSPGLVGATLGDRNVYAGIIADGHHVHFGSIELVQRILKDRLILVSDATPPVGTTMTSFQIGGQEVFYRDGKCISADGTLGGSALTLIEAIRNCVQHLDLTLAEAFRMASLYPARLLGMDSELGIIAPSAIANLTVINQALEVVGVVDQGHWLDFGL